MGYTASGCGKIEFSCNTDSICKMSLGDMTGKQVFDALFGEEGCFTETSVGTSDTSVSFVHYTDWNYHDEYFLPLLNMLAPVIDSGEVEFDGEDGSYWRFKFDSSAQKWLEEDGVFIYEDEYNMLTKIKEVFKNYVMLPYEGFSVCNGSATDPIIAERLMDDCGADEEMLRFCGLEELLFAKSEE